jgi:hypothetical protein
MALLLGRHYEFPQSGIIKEKLLLLKSSGNQQQRIHILRRNPADKGFDGEDHAIHELEFLKQTQ